MALPVAARPPWLGMMDAFPRGMHPTYTPSCPFTSRRGLPWFGEGVLQPDIARVVNALAHLPLVDVTGNLLVPR